MSTLDSAALIALKDKAAEVAELLRQLANPTRLLLLCHIAQGERSVSQLEAETGLRQPGLSQQLAELRQSGLVRTRRESRLIFYSIADNRAQVLMQTLHEVFCASPADPPVVNAAVSTPILTGPPDTSRPTPPSTLSSVGDAAHFARLIQR